MPPARCPYCHVTKTTTASVNKHVSASKPCNEKWQEALVAQWDVPPTQSPKRNMPPRAETPLNDADITMDVLDDYQLPPELVDVCESQQAQVEDVEDEGEPPIGPHCERYIHEYPRPAGSWIRKANTGFESLLEDLIVEGRERWEPFEMKEEWELVTWLMKNVQNQNLSFHNNYSFLKKVDALPMGPEWDCQIVHINGDRVGEDGKVMSEDLELWMRDPVECIRELMGNPAFADLMAYVPERAYTDEGCTNRIYDKMWTGEWWWNAQASLDNNKIILE
ncbi:hypothetical protein DXG01_004385 [Tephrocybe rancida]|nr:hypothetical protein DXG01_004385 [Tephrocybe rancida]